MDERPIENQDKKNFFNEHVDTIVVLGAIFTSFLWMNSEFNDIKLRLNTIETVLIVKGVMTTELCKKEDIK